MDYTEHPSMNANPLWQIDRYRGRRNSDLPDCPSVAEFHVIQIAFHDLLVEGRVLRPRKYNMHVEAV